MDDVVAIKVRDGKRGWVGFITWGRLWDPVDDTELLGAIRPHLHECGIDEPLEVVLCSALREVQSGEYFYEALLKFSWNGPTFGANYAAWREARRDDLKRGREIYCVGSLQPDIA